jgi:hypothetical protein
MATSTSFTVLREVFHEHGNTGWRLCFQYGVLVFGDDGTHETGYRFVWRRPPNAVGKRTLQSARAQARIPSVWIIRKLISAAEAAGWGSHDADLEDGVLPQITVEEEARVGAD